MTDVIDSPTTSPISTTRHGDVLIVTSNNPPVNALGAAVRQGLVAAIEEAEKDDAIRWNSRVNGDEIDFVRGMMQSLIASW